MMETAKWTDPKPDCSRWQLRYCFKTDANWFYNESRKFNKHQKFTVRENRAPWITQQCGIINKYWYCIEVRCQLSCHRPFLLVKLIVNGNFIICKLNYICRLYWRNQFKFNSEIHRPIYLHSLIYTYVMHIWPSDIVFR